MFPGAPVHSGTTAWLHDAGFGGWGTIFARHIAFCGWPSCGMLGLCRVAAAGDSTSTPAAHSSTQELHGRIGVRHSRMFARAHTHIHTHAHAHTCTRACSRAQVQSGRCQPRSRRRVPPTPCLRHGRQRPTAAAACGRPARALCRCGRCCEGAGGFKVVRGKEYGGGARSERWGS